MEPAGGKHSFLRNILVRLFIFCLLFIGIRFAYVVTIHGESCDTGDFCFFSLPENINLVTGIGQRGSSSATISGAVAKSSPAVSELWATREFQRSVRYYTSVFQDLIGDGALTADSKALCLDTSAGDDVYALKEIGVEDSIGVYKKAAKPLVISGSAVNLPFKDNTFDFVFSGVGGLDRSAKPAEFAVEVSRTLKPEGYFVVHTASKDTFSFNSFIGLFNCCTFIKSHDVDGFDSSSTKSKIREFVMRKKAEFLIQEVHGNDNGNSGKECSVPDFKRDLIKKAEPLIKEEPLKPWITLKRNIQNVNYLPAMADINFKPRYVYVDVGARSYGSSIASWFKKQYPKQNKTFEIYAIEADKHFHEQYKLKKGVTLLPYAAWVRNESLSFEINQDPGDKNVEKGRGMGRIQSVKSSGGIVSDVDKIQGFDFAEWLKSTVTEKDFVVMKMDVEGTEFDLIPRLIKTGAICLIDEIFLECHYNRWQKCCPGERSPKYQKTYGQCLDLFTSLRERGVLVHQWW